MFILSLLVFVLVISYYRVKVSALTLIRSEKKGLLTYELRRVAQMVQPPLNVAAFPEPRETRMEVISLAGVVLSYTALTLALPRDTAERIEKVTDQEFDSLFPSWLQVSGEAKCLSHCVSEKCHSLVH